MQNQQLAIREDLPLDQLGTILAKSGFFSDVREAGQAIVKVLAGRELGFGPIASMTGIYIVKGRVTLSANLMAAAIKRSGRYNYRVRKQGADACAVEFFEKSGDKWESLGVSEFTAADAKRANLGGDNWSKYPSNMLFARAMSNGVKWYCPDIFGGPAYTPDEMGEVVDGETGEVIEATKPEAPKPEPAPQAQPAATALVYTPQEYEAAKNTVDSHGVKYGDKPDAELEKISQSKTRPELARAASVVLAESKLLRQALIDAQKADNAADNMPF